MHPTGETGLPWARATPDVLELPLAINLLAVFFGALGGTLRAGEEEHTDLVGVFTLAAAMGFGGGLVRDLLLGNLPPAAFRDPLLPGCRRRGRTASACCSCTTCASWGPSCGPSTPSSSACSPASAPSGAARGPRPAALHHHRHPRLGGRPHPDRPAARPALVHHVCGPAQRGRGHGGRGRLRAALHGHAAGDLHRNRRPGDGAGAPHGTRLPPHGPPAAQARLRPHASSAARPRALCSACAADAKGSADPVE